MITPPGTTTLHRCVYPAPNNPGADDFVTGAVYHHNLAAGFYVLEGRYCVMRPQTGRNSLGCKSTLVDQVQEDVECVCSLSCA